MNSLTGNQQNVNIRNISGPKKRFLEPEKFDEFRNAKQRRPEFCENNAVIDS